MGRHLQRGHLQRGRGQGGFTLVEFLIVLGIMTILSGIVVFAIGKARENAAKNACLTEQGVFETAGNAASIDPAITSISDYLKSPSGLYFEVTGSTTFSRVTGSEFDNDCQPI